MKKTAAPIEAPYAEGTDPADAPEVTKAMAERIHALLLDIDPSWLAATEGEANRLLIVQATGAPAFKALSGDATLAANGVITIGNEKVKTAMLAALAVTEAILGGESVATAKVKALAITAAKLAAEAVETAKIQNLAVTEGKIAGLAVATGKIAELAVTTAKLANLCVTEVKIADAAVTSRKYKPTIGIKRATGVKALAEAYADIPGLSLTLTPSVASILSVNICMGLSGMLTNVEPSTLQLGFRLLVDGVEHSLDGSGGEATPAFRVSKGGPNFKQAEFDGEASALALIALSAAEHTIKIQARKVSGTEGFTLPTSAMLYELVAS